MSLKRKLLGASVFGLASLPVSGAIARNTLAPYHKNQPSRFYRQGRVVDNPFYRDAQKRENIIKMIGATGAGLLGAKHLPRAIKPLSDALGRSEYRNAKISVDKLIEEAVKAQNKMYKEARRVPLLSTPLYKQISDLGVKIEDLKKLRKGMTEKSFVDHRGQQMLGLSPKGTPKQVADILGLHQTILGSRTLGRIKPALSIEDMTKIITNSVGRL